MLHNHEKYLKYTTKQNKNNKFWRRGIKSVKSYVISFIVSTKNNELRFQRRNRNKDCWELIIHLKIRYHNLRPLLDLKQVI